MTAILIVGLVVAVLWGAVIFLRGGLLAGCLVVLLAASCFGHPFYRLPMGPVPLTLDRILWVVLLVQYVIWRRMGLADRKPPGNAEIVLCALVGVLFVSTFSHDWQAHHHQPVARLILAYLMPLGLYWIARQTRLSERGVLMMFACLGAFGLYLAVTALAETAGLWWMVYPKYIVSTDYREFLGRARGPVLNPAGSGLLQAVCLCAGLMWWPRLNRRGRALLLTAALAMGLGIYCTLTRSVWLGAGLGLFILLSLTIPRSWRVPVLGSSLLVAAVVGVTQWEHILAFKRDRDLGAQETFNSVKLRPILATVAWNMFRDRPILGCGFAQYKGENADYVADRSSGLPLEKARPYVQHNVFLSLLVETGLLGMGLFVTLLALWLRDAWRLWRSPAAPGWARQVALLLLVLLANYFAGGMFHDVSLIFVVHLLLFFVAGVTAGLRQHAEATGTAPFATAPFATGTCWASRWYRRGSSPS